VNRNYEYLFANEAYGEILGLPAQNIVGRRVPDILPSVWSQVQPRLDRALAGEHVEYELTLPADAAQGQPVTLAVNYQPHQDNEGRPAVVVVVLDITERKRAQEALRGGAESLRLANRALTRSNEDLERFAFIASHDLQEPLRMITTYAQLLVKQFESAAGGQAEMYVRNISQGTARMHELITDLLAFTEIRGEGDTPGEEVDLNRILDTVKLNLKAAIDDSGAVIAADPLPTIRGHAAHFIPLFQNLVSNAIKYRSERVPRIHITVEKHDGLHFALSDNGIGIEPQYHERIFVAFKRLHGRKIPGTGIGLAICQRIVERYGGRIWVESESGAGSTFHFTLPDAGVPPSN
jgi:PAS domain S-box-containing protein